MSLNHAIQRLKYVEPITLGSGDHDPNNLGTQFAIRSGATLDAPFVWVDMTRTYGFSLRLEDQSGTFTGLTDREKEVVARLKAYFDGGGDLDFKVISALPWVKEWLESLS